MSYSIQPRSCVARGGNGSAPAIRGSWRGIPGSRSTACDSTAFGEPAAQDILKLSRIVAWCGFVRQVKMTVDNIVHVLKHHCGALLYLLRGIQYRRCAALCRTQRRRKREAWP